MDDPGWSWPAWKFGLKRDDLFTSLHDRYNTFTFSLQDPEAFHADVCEVSHDADTLDEFHRLMADRRQQRLRELHDSLESLAVEIIANPKLMDSEHWNYAVQLFRTKSFDSLVRYFASYLPTPEEDEAGDDNSSRRTMSTDSITSDASTATTAVSSTVDHDSVPAKYTSFLDDNIVTEEPQELEHDAIETTTVGAPLTPPASETTGSHLKSLDHVNVRHSSTNPPSRSMSFSGSESGEFCRPSFHRGISHDDDASSQSDSIGASDSSVSDCGESHSSLESVDDKRQDTHTFVTVDDEDDELVTAQFPEDAFDAFDNNMNKNMENMMGGIAHPPLVYETTEESDTPTPRQECPSNPIASPSYIDYRAVLGRRQPSPTRRSNLSSLDTRSHRSGTGAMTPPREVRRSPEEAYSKIQKQNPDASKRRARGRI